jgi:predicted nucleic acid-binding protein
LKHPEIENVFTTAATFAEVEEYATVLGRRKRLDPDVLILAVAALPVTIVERADYESAISKARKLIGKRDADDIDLLALALHRQIPLWSNDNDFEECGVEWFTTAEILRRLGVFGT